MDHRVKPGDDEGKRSIPVDLDSMMEFCFTDGQGSHRRSRIWPE
jgi:hypothetical protein